MVVLHGRAGRLTAENGGFRPGQNSGAKPGMCLSGGTAPGQHLAWASALGAEPLPARPQWYRYGAIRVISDCHFRKKATEYDRKSGIKWLSCTEK
jgi:hypothetical protein